MSPGIRRPRSASRELAERVQELEARLDHERLYPLEWVNRRVRDRLGEEVQTGPFAGVRYPDWGFERVELFSPKLIGCFERELHPAVERAIAAGPGLVVNIGAADGWYAIGLARRLPEARVLAFEAEESKHWLLDELATLNGVRERIEVLGACGPSTLAEHLEPGALIVCDCEGCEVPVLDPALVPALRDCVLVVEAHDGPELPVTAILHERFGGTHVIEEIAAEPRYVDDFPLLGDLPQVTRQLAIWEFRGVPMRWLVMQPRETLVTGG